MPKAAEVAQELRRIADVLDNNPETEVMRPDLSFFHFSNKDDFMRLAKIFPRPYEKEYGGGEQYSRIRLVHKTPSVEVTASIYRSAVCTLITPARPAEYDCEPLLSFEEESELESA